MKKILAAVAALGMILCPGVMEQARGAEVQAESGFLAGSFEAWGPFTLSADTSGFYLAIGGKGAEQTGVQARLWDLEGDGIAASGPSLLATRVKAYRTDFLVTGFITRKAWKIKGFGGYSASTCQLTAGTGVGILTVRASGPVAGMEWEGPISGKTGLLLMAALRPGLGVEQKTPLDWLGEMETIQGTGEGYDFAAVFRFAVNPDLALEAGYVNQTFGWRHDGEKLRKDTFSQIYAGISCDF